MRATPTRLHVSRAQELLIARKPHTFRTRVLCMTRDAAIADVDTCPHLHVMHCASCIRLPSDYIGM